MPVRIALLCSFTRTRDPWGSKIEIARQKTELPPIEKQKLKTKKMWMENESQKSKR